MFHSPFRIHATTTSPPLMSPSVSSDYSSPSESPLPSPAFSPSTLPRSPVINVNINAGASPRRTHARSLSHLKFDLDFDSAPTSPSLPSPVSARSQSFHEDVLSPGDLVGEHLCLQNEPISRVPAPPRNVPLAQEPMQEFEVVRRLGTGSYAVVYLVREVIARRDLSDDGCIGGRMDVMSADSDHGESREYGRNYAVKVLSKANLDQEALDAQMAEANIHQSIPSHPNIVTLHRTLETPSFLLLLLEFVPGADLFYFLEQARDHYEPDPATLASPISPTSADPSLSLDKATDSSDHASHSSNSSSSSHTPPTPSLLSTLNANQLLSRTRLRLIASMFAQMCEAVAACHDAGVFHRDIKPENFIVTDARAERERRVVVKLTDFGLSTMDAASADMDCGSAPYMSYECRNNCAPTYAPRAADVWSLGIVLINMLYHINPWTDTTQGVCTSFSFFRADPIAFFTSRFAGMTPAVATFLTERVFCILDSDDPLDKRGRRISAHDFGVWVKDLPALLGPGSSSLSSNGIASPSPATVISTAPAMNSTTTSPCASTLSSPTAFSPPSLYSALQHHQQTQHQPMAFSSSTSSRVLPPGVTVISHKRGASASSIGFSLSSVPQSRRPSSRQASISDHPAPTAGAAANAASGTASGTATPALRGRSLSRAPSFGVEGTPAGAANMIELPTVFDNGLEEDGEGEMEAEAEAEMEMEAEMEAEMDAEDAEVGTESGSRSTSVVRRRKRGARRGKGLQQLQQQQAPPLPTSSVPSPGTVDTLKTLASASQSLARELSRQSRASQSGRPPVVHVSVPVHLVQAQAQAQTQQTQSEPLRPSMPFALTSLPAKPTKSAPATPTIPSAAIAPAGAKVGIVKKASKWKLGFGKSSSSNGGSGAKVPESAGGVGSGAGYGNASGSGAGLGGRVDENVIRSNLGVGVGMGAIDTNVHLSSVANGHSPVRVRSQGSSAQAAPISMSPAPSSPHADARSRGRGTRPAPLAGLDGSSAINSQTIETWAHNVQTGNTSHPAGSFNPSSSNVNVNVSNTSANLRKANPSITNSERNVSPMSTRRPASSAASIAPSSTSSNWRSSSSTASTSTSAFTRYSNGSARSLSTAATSVSAGSWRNPSSASLASNKPTSSPAPSIHHAQNPGKGAGQGHPDMPPGVKFMTGVPWALHQFPRHMHPSPVGDIYYAQPPPRKPRVRKPKDLPQDLPTINERPGRSPLSQRQDAGASTTDLRGSGSSNASFDGDAGDGVPRKVQKGQINALAKMLSAFKLS